MSFYQRTTTWLNRNDLLLFSILILINIVPLLTTKITTSLDGPQHLYVSNVIIELLKGNDFYSQFFKINELPVGYWTGHFILAILNYFFEWWMAEKLLLIIYYVAIAFAFRYAVKSINSKASLLYSIILPFAGNYFLVLGYFNLSYSFIFLFLCLGYWIRIQNNPNVKNGIGLMILLLILFFTHAFTFAIFWFIAGIYLLESFFAKAKSLKFRDNIKEHFYKAIFLFASGLLSIIFWFNYIFKIQSITTFNKLAFADESTLWDAFTNLRILISFHVEKEIPVSHVIGILLVMLSLFYFAQKFYTRYYLKARRDDPQNEVFLFVAAVIILLYFLFPNTYISGNISKRILIIFFLVYILWLSSRKFPASIVFLSVLIISAVTIYHRKTQLEFYKNIAIRVKEVREVTDHMNPNTVYLPINSSSVWTYRHLSTLAGIEEPYVNVMAPQVLGQFVLKTTGEEAPLLYLGTENSYQLHQYWKTSGSRNSSPRTIDYVIIIDPDKFWQASADKKIKKQIKENYKKIYTTSWEFVDLYQINSLVKEP